MLGLANLFLAVRAAPAQAGALRPTPGRPRPRSPLPAPHRPKTTPHRTRPLSQRFVPQLFRAFLGHLVYLPRRHGAARIRLCHREHCRPCFRMCPQRARQLGTGRPLPPRHRRCLRLSVRRPSAPVAILAPPNPLHMVRVESHAGPTAQRRIDALTAPRITRRSTGRPAVVTGVRP